MKIQEAYETLRKLATGFLYKDETGNYKFPRDNFQTPYLESIPGIGKSEMVKQLAEDMNIGFAHCDLSAKTRTGMEGLPIIVNGEDGTYTKMTPSSIIGLVNEEVKNGKNEGILFLDELPSVAMSLLGVLHYLLQFRSIGDYRLPDGWIIVAAGNPQKFNRAASDLGDSIIDRLIRFEVECDANSTVDYLYKKKLNIVADYLSVNKKDVYYIPNSKSDMESSMVTPRDWTNLAIMMKSLEELGIEVDEAIINGYIKCKAIAGKFYKYYKERISVISVADIRLIGDGKVDKDFKDRMNRLKFEQKFHVTQMCLNYMKDIADRKKASEENINNIISFIDYIDVTGDLSEILINGVNTDMGLLDIVKNRKVPAYNKYILSKYDMASGE